MEEAEEPALLEEAHTLCSQGKVVKSVVDVVQKCSLGASRTCAAYEWVGNMHLEGGNLEVGVTLFGYAVGSGVRVYADAGRASTSVRGADVIDTLTRYRFPEHQLGTK